MTKQRQSLGRAGEIVAVNYLRDRGWMIVCQNLRRREGEIDVVALRGDTLAFVEVKARRTFAYGDPCEAVTKRKRARIRSLAAALLADGAVPHAREISFDVIEVTTDEQGYLVRHLPGVF